VNQRPLSPHELRRIAVVALLDTKTVARCYSGGPVRDLTRLRVERAARELGFLPPPKPEAKSIGAPAHLSVVASDEKAGEEGSQ